MAKLISGVYGEALYDTAVSSERADDMLEEIGVIKKVLDENPDFTKLMLHPSVSKEDKKKIVEETFRGRVMDELTGFILTVVEKERFKELDSIFEYFTDRIKADRGIGVVYITSPMDLDINTRLAVEERIRQTTSYVTLETHYNVDPSIIGGIVIRIGDRVADASVKTRLDDLTSKLLDIQLG
ncbi:MAG: ATP synthase F1 subunit delta [Lachnospiraceae bacterium]|nr:ATP synthase F1 subunit delta [Lachnospiraceae bacterium]